MFEAVGLTSDRSLLCWSIFEVWPLGEIPAEGADDREALYVVLLLLEESSIAQEAPICIKNYINTSVL